MKQGMNGLELARAYYEAHGAPMLAQQFPTQAGRIAVGLVGEGSECFGFDDALSRDHDFGPAFCLWLTRDDFALIGADLQAAYERLPGEFMGFPARRDGPHSGGRVGVFSIDAFYRMLIGRADADFSPLEWLHTPESRLALATNGAVFHDPLGEFSAIRAKLAAFYPDDVRLKKIAARAVVMGQSGQYNFARCLCRGEIVAAQLALAEFTQHAMSMIFLLNRRYMPFYKWAHRALAGLPVLGAEMHALLAELAVTGLQPEAWADPNGPDPQRLRRLNLDDRNIVLIEKVCGLVKQRLQYEGLTGSDDDFLAEHAGHIISRITDPGLKSRHLLEG